MLRIQGSKKFPLHILEHRNIFTLQILAKVLNLRKVHLTQIINMNEPFAEGNIYHIFNRGCNRENIFFKEENYIFLLKKVNQTVSKYGVTVLAYCLMPNHYHFLLRQETDRPLSDWIKQLFNGYVQAVNKQFARSGTLFQGRAKHVLVDKSEYFIHLARYIHLNPVEAGLVKSPGAWSFSNYLEWVEERNGSLVNHTFIKSYFKNPDEYRQFVQDYQNEKIQTELKVYLLD